MAFLNTVGVQFPMGRKQHSSLTLRIPDERGLVKLRKESAGNEGRNRHQNFHHKTAGILHPDGLVSIPTMS